MDECVITMERKVNAAHFINNENRESGGTESSFRNSSNRRRYNKEVINAGMR